jgi:hypothetical protein
MPAEDVIAELSAKKKAAPAPAPVAVADDPYNLASFPLRHDEKIVKVDGKVYRKRPGKAKNSFRMVRVR